MYNVRKNIQCWEDLFFLFLDNDFMILDFANPNYIENPKVLLQLITEYLPFIKNFPVLFTMTNIHPFFSHSQYTHSHDLIVPRLERHC